MKKAIQTILNIILISIFIFSSYKVIMYVKDSISNKNVMKNIGVELSPSVKENETSPLEFTKNLMLKRKEVVNTLKQKNNDVIGWIYIYDTKVDYPIVKGKDNSYYLSHDIEKNKSKYGSIFMDYKNNPTDLDGVNSNVVLYGHRMRDNQMFGSLDKFSDKEYFKGKYPIAIILNDKEYYFEAFSSYVTSSDDNYIQTSFNNKEYFDKFVQKCCNKSHTLLNTDIGSINNILTLSTCSYEFEDARLVVHAKLIENN